VLEDPWFDAGSLEMRDIYKLSVAPEDAPNDAECIDLTFENGNCVNVTQVLKMRSAPGGTTSMSSQNLGPPVRRAQGRLSASLQMSPLAVMLTLNELGGKHGIGRVDIVENRFVGMKGRGVYETPGGAILHFAHRQMETLTMDREVMHLRDSLIPRYSTLVYNGFWFSPEREGLQALVTESQRDITGLVRLKLYKGNIIVAGRKSPKSLYDPKIATMEGDRSSYNQSDAAGFIRLNALRLKLRAAKGRGGSPEPPAGD
jgi:argininosuccinate synthase